MAKAITFKEIYERWSKTKYERVQHSAILSYQAAFKALHKLHNTRFIDIRTDQMQTAIDNCGKGSATKKNIKYLLCQMSKYAEQNDIISKDYSKFIDIGKYEVTEEKVPFTPEEIKILWKNISTDFVDTIIIMIYTGFRIGELLDMKNNNINFEENTMAGGKKTTAGRNRKVPMHRDIIPLVKARHDSNNEFFITNHKGKKMSYDMYYKSNFLRIMESLSMTHKPHDCRHTFATLLSNADANTAAISKLIGHTKYSLTEKVYTHKTLKDLETEINKINK